MSKIENIYQLVSLGNHDFIDEAYRAILGREPDEDGRESLYQQLCKGEDKLRLAIAMAKSVEGKAHGSELAGLKDEVTRDQQESIFLIGPFIKIANIFKYVIKNINLIKANLYNLTSDIQTIKATQEFNFQELNTFYLSEFERHTQVIEKIESLDRFYGLFHSLELKIHELEQKTALIDAKNEENAQYQLALLEKYKDLYLSSDLIIEKMQSVLSENNLNNNADLVMQRVKRFDSVVEKYNRNR